MSGTISSAWRSRPQRLSGIPALPRQPHRSSAFPTMIGRSGSAVLPREVITWSDIAASGIRADRHQSISRFAMPDHENEHTQRDIRFGIAAELTAAGFEDAEEIGRGGFGVVYRCLEPSLDRTVAVKVLTSEISGDERERFVREQHALGRLSGHPNIVAIHQADVTADGRPFIVMPFHSRGSLDARLRATGPLPWQELLSIGVKIAGALAAAHARGTLHRDVKPANILVTDYGEPQLADFGIAHIGGGFETSAGRITGTPAFIAPEVLRVRRRARLRTFTASALPCSAC